MAQETGIDYLESILKKSKKENNLQLEVQTENAIGEYYYKKNDLSKSERYFNKSLKNNDGKYVEEFIASNVGIGDIRSTQKKLEEAKNIYANMLKIAENNNLLDKQNEIRNKIIEVENRFLALNNAGRKYTELKSLDKNEAIDYIIDKSDESKAENDAFLKKIKHLSKENQLNEMMLRLSKSALSEKELQIELLNQYNQTKEFELQHRSNELKTKNAIIAKKNAQNEKQKIIIGFSVTGLVLLIFFAIYIFRTNLQRKKHNAALQEKNAIIVKKNQEIIDSINYAKKIQEATLQSSKNELSHLSDNLIYFKPKDIVSGDFYWLRVVGNKIIWAVVDCTGHGVPGAFMSMIGNRLLNEIIIEKKYLEASQILDELKIKIIQSLNQEGKTEDSKDGMDISLCVYDKDTQMIDFAGANNPIYLVRKNISNEIDWKGDTYKSFNADLIEIKANRFPVGYHPYIQSNFTSFQFKVQRGDVIYMSSDGFRDQFGGDQSKKYTSKKFKQLLVSIADLPMQEQNAVLESTFEKWKKNHEQVDDVCILGLRM
jgi:serine phosphatase RsbU (regulator of sigma subunit)